MTVIITRKDWHLRDTSVENLFIHEFMTDAPGEYVKVYIYALMNAQMDVDIDDNRIAEILSMDKTEVEHAWEYWEKSGVVERFGDNVRILDLKDDGPKTVKPSPLEDEEFRLLLETIEQITCRTLNGTEVRAIRDWIDDLKAEADIIMYAYNYCQERGKTDYRYVGKVLSGWMEKGYSTPEEIEAHLGKVNERRSRYRDIFRRLGFNRNWTEKEKEVMDKWIDDWGFSMERIFEACDTTAGTPNPNLKYVNKVLENWKEAAGEDSTVGKKISVARVMEYYEELRKQKEEEAAERKSQVYALVPGVRDIDDEIKDTNMALTKAMLDRNEDKRVDLQQKLEGLYADRAAMMTDNGFDPEYMNVKYNCNICKDTGLDNEGNRCSCFEERTREALEWMKEKKTKG